MSKSIHTTVAGAARNNSRADLEDPDNADVANLAKKIAYKKAERRKRQSNAAAATDLALSKRGLPEA